jgi:F-box protein 18 (helicase)
LSKFHRFQIYLFRGAVNALGSVESTQTFYLTQSFRFGPEIGFAADAFLTTQKCVDRQTLVGGEKRDYVVSRCDVDVKDKEFRPVAIIGRTNIGLFSEVVKLVCEAETSSRPKASFAGGFDSYNFDDYLDIYHLSVGQNQKMKKWKKFRNFESFQQFAKNTNDPELLSKIEIVKAYGSRLPGLIDKLGRFCKSDPKSSDFVFTTVHKSKGLEWQSVVLLDDFREIPGGSSLFMFVCLSFFFFLLCVLLSLIFTTVHKLKGLEWHSVILLDDFREIPSGLPFFLYVCLFIFLSFNPIV